MHLKRRAVVIALAAVAISSACRSGGVAPEPASPATVASPATATARATPAAASPGPAATPACRAPAQSAVEQTEGPFFKSGSPQRASLLASGMAGTPLVVSGFVVTRSCRPAAGVKLDFWHADATGQYDNAGFALRGHQFTDPQGRYRLETIVPGRYPGRTPHLHVKVTPAGGRTLTTQLYLPDEPGNAADSIFRPELVIRLDRAATPLAGSFDFVLDLP